MPTVPAASATSFETLLHQPEVIAALERALRKFGTQAQDVEDGRQTVWLRALQWKGERPTTAGGVTGLCIVIARCYCAGEYRKKKEREALGDAGLTAVPDEHLAPVDTLFDRLDAAKLLALIEGLLPKDLLEILGSVAVGIPQPQIAVETKLPYPKVRDGLEKARRILRKSAPFAAFIAAAATVYFLFLRGTPAPEDQARPTPSVAPSEVLVEQDPDAPKKLEAARLRQKADAECGAGQWHDCEVTLDSAQTLDPAGETGHVRELRGEIAREMMAKPIPRPSLPKPKK